jgi:hypothetical protein
MFDAAHLKALYHTSKVYEYEKKHKMILAEEIPKASDEVIEQK